MTLVWEVVAGDVRGGVAQFAAVYLATVLGAVQLDRYLHRRRMDALVAQSLDGIDRGKVEA